jgi:hypothetical protein
VAATFSQPSGAALWSLDDGPVTCVVAYAPFDPGPVPTSGVSLSDTWSTYPGTYVVLPAGTTLGSTLAASLATYLGWRTQGTARFTWIANPTADPHDWVAPTLAFDGSMTTGLNGIGLRNLALWIGARCAAAPDSEGDAVVLTVAEGAVSLTADFGAITFPATGSTLSIPFSGPQAGCIVTAAALPSGALAELDVGVRIFAPTPGTSPLTTRLVSYRYPVFAETALPVSVSLDPVAALDDTRTFLGLVPAGETTGPKLASCYQTVNRLPVLLTPLADPVAKLVLAVRALSDPPSPFDPYYVVPRGGFAIQVGANGDPQKLMCGTSGIEYVELPGAGSELWFSPCGAALVGDQGLTGTATTAYASVFGASGAGGLVYHAQPDGSPLFAASDTPSFLSFHELPGATLPTPPGDGTLPAGFPMAPYTGIVDDDLAPYQELEYQAIAPTRRKAIGGATAHGPTAAGNGNGNGTTPTVTPQGLLADAGASGIVNLTLLVSGAGAVEIQGVSSALASALQSNQLFLVASDPTGLQAQPPQAPVAGTVTIPANPQNTEQWTLDVWPATWAAMDTLLVFKFAGKSLSDLAADTSTWVQAEDFNGGTAAGVQAAQTALLAMIAEAAERAATDAEFQPFAKLAGDPLWQGLLVLNAPIPAGQLPSQLAGLAAGIDAAQFKAHHLGLTVTPVDAGSGSPQQKLSSLFGLIFYESPHSAAGAQGPYAFNVLTLKVRFENSAVATFSSEIQLLVDELFGEPATRTDIAKKAPCADNVLILYGVYQQQGTTSGYTFSTDQDTVFVMRSGVLSSVEIATAQFVTVVPPPANPAESRFVLNGALRFQPGQFDLFSFGPQTADALPLSPERLAFASLAIDLQYDPSDSTKDVYSFDATKLMLDASQSQARPTGVFNDFPLTLSGFVHVEPAAARASGSPASPSSMGYLGVDVPGLPQGSIKAPWFGIVADLGLGTPGALAAEVGFKASLLAAWAPGKPDAPNVGVGLKLPGTGSGGKLLSLESVLKLKVGDVSLVRDDNAYVLGLEQISLSLLTLSFPPGGQVDALLFADPTGQDRTALGWYAGYAKTGGKS